MNKALKTIALLAISGLILPAVLSCAGTAEKAITQEEYNALQAQLSDAEAKIAEAKAKVTELEAKQGGTAAEPGEKSLQDEIDTLNAKIKELGNTIADSDKKYGILAQGKDSLEAQHAELNGKYDELQKTLAALTQPEIITEEKIEAEILRLVNQERVKAGVPEFLPGTNLHGQAKQISRDMAASGKIEVNPAVFYAEEFWAAGYDTVNAIARGALLTWQLNQYRMEHGALLASNKYGAVGAYKSGEIFYITLMAAPFM